MKIMRGIFLLIFASFLAASPVLACQCSTAQSCCGSCCEHCVTPLKAGAVNDNAVTPAVVKVSFDELSFQITEHTPARPDDNLIVSFNESDVPFLSSVFKITNTARAPPLA